jgi:crotonobetainyl-CoA:carnitine CoA-transferase CaiB-like acyl-CoA transferase
MTESPLPLAGLRVLDISSFIAAPAAATVLGDWGADVIKIEGPDGDPNRTIMNDSANYPKGTVNYPWQMDSRNKRSLVLDLKKPEARAALDRLIDISDILVCNFPPPVRAKLRLGYDDVKSVNPRLIYASLTGYGETGPDRDRPGFDATAYFARSGLLDAQRYEGGPPGVPGPAQGDRATAMALVSAILMALIHRMKTGEGSWVGTSLLGNGLWSCGVIAQAALVGAFLPHRPPPDRPRSALGNIYRTSDDRWLQLTIVREDKMWGPLCEAVGHPELVGDPRFAEIGERRKHAAELAGILSAAFLGRDYAHWLHALALHSITFGAISRPQDIPDDVQAFHAGAIVETAIPDMPLTLANPIHVSFAKQRIAQPAPALGEHGDEVLREAGLTAQEITDLRAGGAVR